jgi:hypothetical protein
MKSEIRFYRRGIHMAKRRDSRAPAMADTYDVDFKIAKKLEKSTYKIDRREELGATNEVAIGRELITIKVLLPHGLFRTFVTNEFHLSAGPRNCE